MNSRRCKHNCVPLSPTYALWEQGYSGSFVWGGSGGAAEWQYLLQDGLGSVRAVADDSAALTQTLDFSPYGVPQGSYGTGFGFTGEYTDANDLLYLRARYYAPEMGVFTALDPMEGKSCTPMSLNGYSWVEGRVINATDPTGLDTFSVNICTATAAACALSLVFVFDNAAGVGFAVDGVVCSAAAAICGTAQLIDIIDDTLGSTAAGFLTSFLGSNNSGSANTSSSFYEQNLLTDETIQTLGGASSTPLYNPTLINDPFSLCRLLNFGVCGLGYDNSVPPIEYPWYVASRNYGVARGIGTLVEHIANIVGWDVGGYSPKQNPDDRDRSGWCETVKRVIENIQSVFEQSSDAQIVRDLQNANVYNIYDLDEIEDLLEYIVEQELCDDYWGDFSPVGFSFPR